MAEKIDSFEFTRGAPRGPRGPRGSKYDKWLDGNIYRLIGGVDITVPASGCVAIRKRARVKGLKIRAAVDGENLVIQAYVPGGE